MCFHIKCPVFEEASDYEAFEIKVKAWQEVTSVPVESRGIHLTLSMVEKSEEVLGNVTLDEMKGAEGVNNVLKYLKKAYGKDEMTDTLEKYENYRVLTRTAGQSINAFCTEFEKRVKYIENKGINFPEEVKAFDLLRSAKITREEKKLVLTGVDYSKKDDIFKNALSSLKKFLGETYCSNVVDNSIVKVEDTFFTHRGDFRGRRNSGNNRYRGFGGRFRGVYRGRGGKSNVTLNPMSRAGKRLKCFGCGSINHFRNMCPKNPNKLYSVRYTKDKKDKNLDESVNDNFLCNDHIVLFTGYDKTRISELSIETARGAILDSACSSNVAGLHWYNNFLSIINVREKDIIKSKSNNNFRFGDGPLIKSIFQVKLPADFASKTVILNVDIVDADIPFLLSKNEMKKQNMILDLTNDYVKIDGKSVFLEEADSGHYILPLIKGCEKIKTNLVYFLGVQEKNNVKVKSSDVKSSDKNKKVRSIREKNNVLREDFDRFTCECEKCVAKGDELDESLDCGDWTEKWLEMCDESIDYNKIFSIRHVKDEEDKGTEETKIVTKYSNKNLMCCDFDFATLQLYYNYIAMLSKKGNIVVEGRGNKLFRAFPLTNSLTQVMSLKMFDTNKVGVTAIPLFSKEIIENQNMVLDLRINFEKTVGSLIHWQQVDYSHYMQFFIESSEVIETNSGLMFEDKSSNHHRKDLYEPSGSGRSETKCKKSGGLDFSNLYGSALVCLADSEKLYSLSKLQYQSKSKGLFNLITDVILWIFKYSYIFEDISRDFSVFQQCIIVYKCYRVFPLGYYLHEVLIFDLKHIKAEYIFYLIDCIKTFTKFVIIKMSKSSIVFKSLNNFVISNGHKTIFSDSRVDLIFQQVYDFYVIKLTIASGALFLGGICEGVVHVTDIILTTLVYICPIEKFDVLLVWANMVLRNPQISEGLHQFVLGWNLRVLNCIYSKLQFLEVCNNSKAFARKMYNFNKAVNAYIQSALTKMEMNYRHYFEKCNLKYCKEQEVAKWLSLALVVFQIIKIICYWIEFYIIEAEEKDNKISSFNKSRGKPCGFIKKVLRCLKYIQKLVEMQENQTQITGYRSGKVNKKNTSSTGLEDVSNSKLVVQCDICYIRSHIEYANMVKEDNEYQDLTVMLICDEQVKICDNVECKFLKDKNKALIEELYSVTCKNKTLEIELEKEKLKGKHLEFKVERFKSILKIIECGSTVSKVVSYKAGKVRKEKNKGVLEKTSQYIGVGRDEIARVGKRISWKEIEPHCIFAKNVIRNQVVKSASSCNMINSNEGKYKKKKTKIKVKFKKTKIKVKFRKTKIKVKSKKTEIKLKSSKKKIVKRIWIKKPWRNKRSSVKRINLYLC